jgi:glycosyltransferase involved in cell wall biosynthesis
MTSKNKVLIVSWDLEIGGVEKSLISMLSNLDYKKFDIDLYLHSHVGELMQQTPNEVNLLPEVPESTTFRMPIKLVFKNGFVKLGLLRTYSKVKSLIFSFLSGKTDVGYYQGITTWKYASLFIPKIKPIYDVAISYSAEHDFCLHNVTAKTKIAWIHTDYLTIDIDVKADLTIWQKFDYIISISDACTEAFLKTHPSLKDKIILVENITSPDYVRAMANNPIEQAFSKEAFNLVSVGRLCYAKAFDRAVEVLSIVHKKGFTNIKWYIVGDGGDREKIQLLIERFNLQESFILLGSTINPYPYMKAADLYIQPSRYEGKAVTISEAQILARPILITNYATSASQIDNGIDGLICEQSVKDIADAIVSLYSNPTLRNSLSVNCSEQDYANTHELSKLYELLN